MAEEVEEDCIDPPQEALFVLDLGGNGGLVAPASLDDLEDWVKREASQWSWLDSADVRGNHDQGLRNAIGQLSQAAEYVRTARQRERSDKESASGLVTAARDTLKDLYLKRGFPHSDSPVGIRIAAYRQHAGDHAGHFYAAVFVPPATGHHFQPQALEGWRGLAEGLAERFRIADEASSGRAQAVEEAFERLRVKAETLVSEKSLVYDELHRNYASVADSIQSTANRHASEFDDAQVDRNSAFKTLEEAHRDGMESLRKTFREEIALRAPAEYWESKRAGHVRLSWITGVLSFGGIAGATALLWQLVHDLLGKAAAGAAPEAWRIALLALVGVFAVWAVRLVVRMFLSQLHLSTDAAERVVMVRTYLSLLEGDRLAGKDDRQLILQTLFRPASDGIVKDEGLPPSMFEFLTRQPKG